MSTIKMNCVMNKLAALTLVGAALMMGGCGSNLYKPEITQATPKKDGVFFLDLRKGPWEVDSPEAKPSVSKILSESCKLEENAGNPVCKNPGMFALYNGQVRNAVWGVGPVFYGIFVPKDLNVRVGGLGVEKDGDIVRGKVISGPVSLLVYDGIIERYDDPNRACKWVGSHNYSGGVVCPKYGYNHEDLDVSKL